MSTYPHPERVSIYQNAVYIIRDVYTDDGKFERCEYAVLDQSRPWFDCMQWVPCPQGTAFAEIAPLVSAQDILKVQADQDRASEAYLAKQKAA